MKILGVLLILAMQVGGQNRFLGIWEGQLEISSGLTIQFVIRDSAGILSGVLNSPDQGAYDIPVDSISVMGDSILLSVRSARITYTGRLVHDSLIEGTFRQGIKLPLSLKKLNQVKKRSKPQTPEPPFNYEVKDVSFPGKEGNIRFAGTLTYPRSKEKTFPTILLITGSGSQNRDEEILGHKPFWVIADHLTKNGYAVLRVDDRGVGQSTGDMSSATSETLATDAEAALDFLRTQPFVNTSKIGLIGHSEGGLIAMMLAARRNDIAFIMLLAAPGVKGAELMAEQNKALLIAGGIPSEAAEKYKQLYQKMVRDMVAAPDSASAYDAGKSALESWLGETDSAMVKRLGLAGKGRPSVFLKAFTKELYTPWMRYFIDADPSLYLKKIQCKVLALNGEKDVQVISKLNLEGIRTALEKNKNAGSFEIKELPGLNHLFQKCDKCIPTEYGKLEETFSEEALTEIVKWLNRQVMSN